MESVRKAGTEGTAESVFNVAAVPGSSAVFVAWHKEINHIAVSGGDGVTRIFYDPAISKKGCLMSAIRAPKRWVCNHLLVLLRGFVGATLPSVVTVCNVVMNGAARDALLDFIGDITPNIMNPNALPMYREDFEYGPL